LGRGPALFCAAALLCCAPAGCAAISNPVADGVPVRYLPPEVLGERKEGLQEIPLNLLRQRTPDAYRLGAGDVLGVYIEGVLGEPTLPVPVSVPLSPGTPPSLGYPLPVRDDGTLPLPLIGPLKVDGMTLTEVQAAVVKAYTIDRKLLKPGRERVIVTLQRPRQYHVLVVRQDGAGPQGGVGGGGGNAQFVFGTTGGGAILGQTRRGAGYSIELPAYENDVLNALARTGGLPGTDAKNEVIIQRGSYSAANFAAFANCPEQAALLGQAGPGGQAGGPQTVRIPLRLRPGTPPPFRPEDVILKDGDIVFIGARNTEVFYTGGLLPARQFILPRDYDLDVLQAVAAVAGPLVNGAVNFNNLSGSIQQPGLGFPSPSQVTVLRRTPGGGQIPIKVSLNRALRDPRERILIQPGDFLILQQTIGEALAQYTISNLRFNFFGTLVNQRDFLLTGTYSAPGP
jgi:protein involved in polysaccharide export with SLBB domain